MLQDKLSPDKHKLSFSLSGIKYQYPSQFSNDPHFVLNDDWSAKRGELEPWVSLFLILYQLKALLDFLSKNPSLLFNLVQIFEESPMSRAMYGIRVEVRNNIIQSSEWEFVSDPNGVSLIWTHCRRAKKNKSEHKRASLFTYSY